MHFCDCDIDHETLSRNTTLRVSNNTLSKDIPYLPIQIINSLGGYAREEFVHILNEFCRGYAYEKKIELTEILPKFGALDKYTKEEKIKKYTPLVRDMIKCIYTVYKKNYKTCYKDMEYYIHDVFVDNYYEKFKGLAPLTENIDKDLFYDISNLRSLYDGYKKEIGEFEEIMNISYDRAKNIMSICFSNYTDIPEDMCIAVCKYNGWLAKSINPNKDDMGSRPDIIDLLCEKL